MGARTKVQLALTALSARPSEAAHCPGVLSLAQISPIFQPGSACAWAWAGSIAAAENTTHGARSLPTIETSLACLLPVGLCLCPPCHKLRCCAFALHLR